MGGRGSSSVSRRSKSSTTAWQDMVAEMGAAAPPASDYDSLESRIPNWFLNKTFTSFGERYAWDNGDNPYIKNETEKAVLIEKRTDYGKLSTWVPKSILKSPEQLRNEDIERAVHKQVSNNYYSYLQGLAKSNNVKLGRVQELDQIKAKLKAADVSYISRQEYVDALKSQSSTEIEAKHPLLVGA